MDICGTCWSPYSLCKENHNHEIEFIDDSIFIALRTLNLNGYLTAGSCGGHTDGQPNEYHGIRIEFMPNIKIPSVPNSKWTTKEFVIGKYTTVTLLYEINEDSGEIGKEAVDILLKRERENLEHWAKTLPQFKKRGRKKNGTGNTNICND